MEDENPAEIKPPKLGDKIKTGNLVADIQMGLLLCANEDMVGLNKELVHNQKILKEKIAELENIILMNKINKNDLMAAQKKCEQ